MATRKEQPNAKQKEAQKRILGIDAEATFEVIDGWVKATYTPAWEVTYNKKPIPNPQRVAFSLDPSGRIAGWGFTSPANFPSLLKACPFDVTTPEDMKAVLQERDALRNPKPEAKEADEAPKPESEAKADNKVPTETATKATPKPKAKPRTRKTGVQVAA